MTLAERLTQLREDMPRWDTASLSPSRVIEIMNTLPALLDLVEAGDEMARLIDLQRNAFYGNAKLTREIDEAAYAFDAAVKRLEAGR